jgi:hypothetical protein|tara:strand:+ start:1360 stop:1524 length:165 start_codon:yes stop_codon:yes gene_type:complete
LELANDPVEIQIDIVIKISSLHYIRVIKHHLLNYSHSASGLAENGNFPLTVAKL